MLLVVFFFVVVLYFVSFYSSNFIHQCMVLNSAAIMGNVNPVLRNHSTSGMDRDFHHPSVNC